MSEPRGGEVLACVVLIGGDLMQDAADIQIVSTSGSAVSK